MKNGRHVSTLRSRSNRVRSLDPGPVGQEPGGILLPRARSGEQKDDAPQTLNI